MEHIANSAPAKKRPVLLTILCVFSFFFSGAMTLFSLSGIIFSGLITDLIRESAPGLDELSGALFIAVFLVLFILFGLSLWGAILMFSLRKGGFVLYVIPNGLKLVLMIIYLLGAFSTWVLVFTLVGAAFIVLYSTQVRKMKG
jgi:hypothetical protein